ncbi:hypothetical protein GCM10010121_085170 [Streptomyces brasiliensis]|uniref:Uncharacterized protein n=1 Tax=Streptomyces brasiliensis TaxID=1954 RepID=A0A917P4N0_9ACTN|nr:hypothetical protein GCM10010121_085170 [Streptomyces brasiliensis]
MMSDLGPAAEVAAAVAGIKPVQSGLVDVAPHGAEAWDGPAHLIGGEREDVQPDGGAGGQQGAVAQRADAAWAGDARMPHDHDAGTGAGSKSNRGTPVSRRL